MPTIFVFHFDRGHCSRIVAQPKGFAKPFTSIWATICSLRLIHTALRFAQQSANGSKQNPGQFRQTRTASPRHTKERTCNEIEFTRESLGIWKERNKQSPGSRRQESVFFRTVLTTKCITTVSFKKGIIAQRTESPCQRFSASDKATLQ